MPGRLLHRYLAVRDETERLAAPLSDEDQCVQSMPDCSPTKWHRAHTTWFFETFVLARSGMAAVDPRYAYLFNSYYDAVGARHPRDKRGLLTRPSVAEIATYRRVVDERMGELLSSLSEREQGALAPIVELGIAHEEQHQELLLTDILHAFSESPLAPVYSHVPYEDAPSSDRLDYVTFEGGPCDIGDDRSLFDHERPRHAVLLRPFALADRLLTVRELRAFVGDGGYRDPQWWLSAGFDWVRRESITAPLHTRFEGDRCFAFGLSGTRELRDDDPIAHVSYFEADALARYLGGRLPTEAEWERVARCHDAVGRFRDARALRPLPANEVPGVRQLFGDAWEWTSSSYSPYPGYRPGPGAIGEYNGKFMIGQQVLRGGSCLSPPGHVGPAYRNYWPPGTRFQMTGVRIARDA